jgi:phosphopantothenoylcysteine decarboxylase / phosphopantothenate---cysteine ligase
MKDSSEKRRILLGVTGSIAAYKGVELARFLISRGYQVRVVLTKSAQKFVTPLTFEIITGSPVITDLWEGNKPDSIDHIALADWADLVLIAPATADCIAKYTYGFSDTALGCLLLATRAPVLIAPAMNVNMWNHPKTIENVRILKDRGVNFVEPESGSLACGWKGVGRLAEAKIIFHYARRLLSNHDLKGRNVLIVTGSTWEKIDAVRFVGNRSSGKMGIALAREVFRRGAAVSMIKGRIRHPVWLDIPTYEVESADEMYEMVHKIAFPNNKSIFDIIIMVAAVSDLRPSTVSSGKLKKTEFPRSINLIENRDILAMLGEKKRELDSSTMLIGFAVETGDISDLLLEAERKLYAKGADLIVGNFAEEAFDLDTNRVWLVDRQGRQEEIGTTYKSRVAQKIVDKILRLDKD